MYCAGVRTPLRRVKPSTERTGSVCALHFVTHPVPKVLGRECSHPVPEVLGRGDWVTGYRRSAFGTVLHVASRRGITEFFPSGRILLHLGTHVAPRPAGAGSYPVGLVLGANSTGYSALQNKFLLLSEQKQLTSTACEVQL